VTPSFVTLNPVQIYCIIFVSQLPTVLNLKYIQFHSKDVEDYTYIKGALGSNFIR